MFVVYECDNKDFSVYVMNYSEKKQQLISMEEFSKSYQIQGIFLK